MATITGLTKDRMQAIIDKTIVTANIVGGHLILTLSDGSTIDAGVAQGPTGPSGIQKLNAFPTIPAPSDGDLVIRIDQPGDPMYKYTSGVWVSAGSGIVKATAFPTAPAPTDGDMVIRTDILGDPIYKYTNGSWEQVPRMGAQNVPAILAYQTVTLTIPNNVTTAMPFDTEVYDTNGIHDIAVNNTQFVCKTPGIYAINGVLGYGGATPVAGERQVEVYLNGTSIWSSESPVNTSSTDWTTFPIATTLKLVAGDVVQFMLWQNSGSSVNLLVGRRFNVAFTWLGGPGQSIDERGVPAARATLTTPNTQTVPVSTVLVGFPTEDWDTDGMHDPSVNNTRVTIKTPGLYDIKGFLELSSGPSGGAIAINVMKNGALLGPDPYILGEQSANVNVGRIGVNGHAVLAAGDYLEIQFVNNTSGTVTVTRSWLSVVLMASGKTVTPYTRVYSTTDTTIPNNAPTILAFNAELADNDGIHDTVSNTTRLTCRTGGVYAVRGGIAWAANSTGLRRAAIVVNGSVVAASGSQAFAAPDSSWTEATAIVELAVGDYVELQAYQTSGGSLIASGSTSATFSMVKIGAPNTPQTPLGPTQSDVYTVATIPAPATFPNGRIVGVSDGAAGTQARMAMNGAWINLG